MSTMTQRERRRSRIRKKVSGSGERPRLSIYRSNAHIYAQVIDDTRGHTLAAASSLDDDVSSDIAKAEIAKRVGELVAQRAQQAGVTQVVFDRGGFRFAGRVKALADGAREGGLDF
ncbi:MAG: 50S ribosomal protein L18 [Actinobacteria bacterium]|nr:50S ribosomal protein L18 [Actinomycetota bacterium]